MDKGKAMPPRVTIVGDAAYRLFLDTEEVLEGEDEDKNCSHWQALDEREPRLQA